VTSNTANGSSATSGLALLARRTGLRNVAYHLARTIAALGLSYLIAHRLTAVTFDDQDFEPGRVAAEVAIHLLVAVVALTIVSAIPIRNDLERIRRLVAANEEELRERSRDQQLLRDVHSAFEMVADEDELRTIAEVALREAAPGRSEILLADASRSHVTRAVVADGRVAPGCDVETPSACPAVRRGQTLSFDDPDGLATCPRLRERDLAAGTAATCVPITVLGVPTAVLHSVHDPDHPHPTRHDIDRLEGVAAQFGARIGMLRAISQSRLQADTDPLTGLLNRRAFEERTRDLREAGTEFALAMADLDHFKQLNDTFGHETGDRALRLFARVAREAVRDGDIVARHGGEEFVLVLPRTNVVTAAPVLHRLRSALAEALTGAQLPPFTVSLGLVDSTWSDQLDVLLRNADRALMHAKADGRDRVVIADGHDAPPISDGLVEAEIITTG
jgi:diguanylate cyclase (GGDEF)-like protein